MCAVQAAAGGKDSGGSRQAQLAEAAAGVPGGTCGDASNGDVQEQAGRQAQGSDAKLAKASGGVSWPRAFPALKAQYHNVRGAGGGGAQLSGQFKSGGLRAGWAGLRDRPSPRDAGGSSERGKSVGAREKGVPARSLLRPSVS